MRYATGANAAPVTAVDVDALEAARAAATFWAGPVEIPATFPLEKFWSRVDKTETCWLWTGRTSEGGYGRFEHRSQTYAAHRLSWLLLCGSIDPTLSVDHLCRVTRCVNPAHLEQVSIRENVLRSDCPPALNAAKTHCYRGHELSSENRDAKGARYCPQCRRDRDLRSRRPHLCPICGEARSRMRIERHIQLHNGGGRRPPRRAAES